LEDSLHNFDILIRNHADKVSFLILEGKLKSVDVKRELLGCKLSKEVKVEFVVVEFYFFLVNKYDFHL